MKTYCIKGDKTTRDPSTGETCFWSNDFGWVTDNFDLFNEDEKNNFNLPIAGKWEVFTKA
jgi:hypothetical protein